MGDERLKAALGYAKFRGTPRILVFRAKYLVIGDVIDAARDLGWEVAELDAKIKGAGEGKFVAELLTALVAHRPDFVVTINHLGFDERGVLSGLLDDYGVPLATWFVDHPLPILGGADANATKTCQVFCFARTAIPWLEERGYESPVFLPTGSNRRYFHPEVAAKASGRFASTALSFAGSSWWTKARTEPTAAAKKAAREVASRGPIDRKLLASGVPDWIDAASRGPDRSAFAGLQVALAESSMRTRGKLVRALRPLGLRLFGDPDWKRVVQGVRVEPYLAYETELPALFAGCGVNANVTAEQMPTAVNQRVWDVPGAGGFLLTDAQEDALAVFEPDLDMAFYATPEEAADKARFFMGRETERRAAAERAFRKVEAAHRATHRLEKMYDVMRARFG
jgi:spore maturation protein CgeB